jgi:neutral ceramidase
MKNIFLLLTFSGLLSVLTTTTPLAGQTAGEKGWKAGVSRGIITPQDSIWLGGYAARTHPSEGVLADLWVRVLAIQDARGRKAVFITSDLLGFPKKMSDRIRNMIAVRYGLTRSQIILSYSHTHSGPVLSDALINIYPLDENQAQVIKDYSTGLEKQIVELTGDALGKLVPVKIFSGSGITRFQVNRRNNSEARLTPQTQLNGPNDYAVPVLKVTDQSGSLLAVIFGYACHATVLDIYQISGDYPGFAEAELEKAHSGTAAMFFQGAGADQNPLPRRSVALARQYGKELAAAVERVLSENMKQLDPLLETSYSEIDVPFSEPPSKDSLLVVERTKDGYQKQWAVNQLKRLKDYGSLMKSYPYPVEVWRMGSQTIVALGGELVVDYAIELKKLYGQDIIVLGYVNDDMAYIPTEAMLGEGGYEGDTSMIAYGLPSKWAPGIEEKIIDEVKKLAGRIGVKINSPYPGQ